ncbi:uncharacterized protein SOCEGT47_041620 [Sorangium cellulosum]|uniref:FAD dependent oxidoreductase domain-containing protein n=1 Tax=Sorangium cellulosum TaxID=56 RepID=A0A4P2Q2X2_SORCE|nr:FAD-dependent oxidoreductase [Sorangium cellulosum]AUX23634.1 uncharacterized protein SOCEGT47_041620 [Sorangium cellulosum]
MVRDYDVIVVGAGIAGLMTAARLAMSGKRVAVFERGLIGARSTAGNHGTIHSGALHARDHAEIVPACAEAVELFASAFPGALVARGAYYFGRAACLAQHAAGWERLGCRFRWASGEELEGLFRRDRSRDLRFALVDDLAMSSRRVVTELLCLCWHLGVDVHPRAAVNDVLVERGEAVGVALSGRGEVTAGEVVLCAGLGLRELAERRSLRMLDSLRPRFDMVAAFKASGLERSIVSLEHGGPMIAPTAGGALLASVHGGAQPLGHPHHRGSVPVVKMFELVERMRFYFRDGLIGYHTGQATMCSRMELDRGGPDAWGIEPRSAIVDHGREDGIARLWTLVPGKLSLGFHASRDLASRLLDAPLGLPLPRAPLDRMIEADAIVEPSPFGAGAGGAPAAAARGSAPAPSRAQRASEPA